MNSTVKKLFRISLLSIVILSGCAYTTAHVDLSYLPEADKKSPLGMIKPMTFALQVEDQRPVGERDRVGDRRGGFGQVAASVKSDKEVTMVLHDALKNELENNGHRVVDTKEAPSDVIIHLGLKRYWSDARMHFWDIEMIGRINADITIRNPRNDSVLFSKPINSTFRESRQLGTGKAYESVLNGALAEFIRSFSRDPSILKALQLAQREEDGA
ncbi:MAG: YajG family lipoprotein [Candidatus Binatia bacterium]